MSLLPSTLSRLCRAPSPTRCEPPRLLFSLFEERGFCSAPGYQAACRGGLLPPPTCSLPKPEPSRLQTPEQSAVERPSPVQGFSLTPGFSHKPPLSQPHLQLLMTTPSPPLDLSNKGRHKKCFILSLRVPNVCSSISYCSRS